MRPLPNQDALSNVPVWLKEIPRWILWRVVGGKKVPCSVLNGRAIKINNPDVGWPFEQAVQAVENRRSAGVGIILNGDGLVAVDLDDCITETGEPVEGVQQLLMDLGAGYVEISPSGCGLHAFGIVDQPKHRGIRTVVGKLSVEMYCDARYMTVTGNVSPSWSTGGEGSQILGYETLLKRAMSARGESGASCDLQLTQEKQEFQDIQDTQDLQARGASLVEISAMPSSCRLERAGDRNAKCFELARWLKAVAPEASLDELRLVVQDWHKMFHDVMETKEFSETWIDFTYGWNKVKHPYGETLKQLFAQLPDLPMWMHGHAFGDRGEKLLRLCVALDERNAGNPFPLAGHALAPYLGCTSQRTYKIINAAATCGYIRLISKGMRRRASEYQLCRRR